jgi:hypothetical protein
MVVVARANPVAVFGRTFREQDLAHLIGQFWSLFIRAIEAAVAAEGEVTSAFLNSMASVQTSPPATRHGAVSTS